MRNDFPSKVYDLFDLGGYALDWEDGRNDADCLHHILGRESNSPFNAAPLNNLRNHLPEGRGQLGAIHSREYRKKLLTKTKHYLEMIGYVPNKKDLLFLEKFKEYYD